jgi:hypothetical protein
MNLILVLPTVLLAYLPCDFRYAKPSNDLPFSHLRISGLLGRVIVKNPRLLWCESISMYVLLSLDANQRMRLLLDQLILGSDP